MGVIEPSEFDRIMATAAPGQALIDGPIDGIVMVEAAQLYHGMLNGAGGRKMPCVFMALALITPPREDLPEQRYTLSTVMTVDLAESISPLLADAAKMAADHHHHHHPKQQDKDANRRWYDQWRNRG